MCAGLTQITVGKQQEKHFTQQPGGRFCVKCFVECRAGRSSQRLIGRIVGFGHRISNYHNYVVNGIGRFLVLQHFCQAGGGELGTFHFLSFHHI